MPGAIAPTAAPPTPLAVRRGNTVLTTWAPTPGLAVTARLESLDDGRLGDTIRLRNRDSGRVVSAQISGQNQAVGQ
jgi:flagella basal body P-ring formation protein FlgA